MNPIENRPVKAGCLSFVSMVLTALWLISSSAALANPMGAVVMSGQASVSGIGTPVVTIQQGTPTVILNWQSFNIGPTELTRFLQPSPTAMALNRILDQNPTQILGSLQANGIVLLLNPNGVLFGPNAQVNVNGLVASSLNLTDQDFLSGHYHFTQSGVAGAVTNAGTIQTTTGGFVYLLAPNVENNGLINSPNGQITLAAGSTVYLSDRPDGLGFLVEVQAPTGAATNLKDLIADGGSIDLYGQVINQSGLIQANSVQQQNGQIRLVASDQVNLAAGSLIEARGDEAGISNGGSVTVDAGQGVTTFEPGAVIDTSGGSLGGNGGSVELSGQSVQLGGQVVSHAADGFQGGSLLIDPYDLTVGESDLLNLLTSGLTTIAFQADHDLTLQGLNVDLSGVPMTGRGSITFTAGHDLQVNDTYLVNDPGGTAALSKILRPWDLSLIAGNDVVLSNSFIGTGAGGNLTVTAGRDVISPSVWSSQYQLYSGFRLDGVTPGTMTINAGRDFDGGFVLTSGAANVTVGGNFGFNPQTGAPDYANLILGMGHISIDAGGDLYLGLVQDKVLAEGRGKFLGIRGVPLLKLADSSNSVALMSETGSIYLDPVSTQDQVENSLQYYPASFSADAPHGSIVIESNLTFWPSATGSVIFTARDDIMGTVQNGQAPTVQFVQSDPNLLQTASAGNLGQILDTPAPSAPVTVAGQAPVQFETQTGDIHDLVLDLRSPSSLPKAVTISSGHDLHNFAALIAAYQCVDGDCPQTVSATDTIDMTQPQSSLLASGVTFFGNGHAEILAGGTLDLADSSGIEFYQGTAPSLGGLLDFGVGGDLRMTLSRIVTYNGASISIHGIGGADTPLGGNVDVGTDTARVLSTALYGILSLHGGDIAIKADGNVEVNSSRVATFSHGNITIESVHGNIDAGSGSRNEQTGFHIPIIDPVTGQPVLDQNGAPEYLSVSVPGSGIFTFDPADPNPLPPYPPAPPLTAFMTPRQKALVTLILEQAIAGHGIPARLNPQYQSTLQSAYKAWSDDYNEILSEFTKDWKLGDIALTALQGSVVVPPAGIRGKNISIQAKNLDLIGGAIVGNLNVDVGNITGNKNGIVGPTFGNLGGSFTVPAPTSSSGLSGLTGSTGSLSSTVTTMTASVADTVQDREEKKAETETAATSGAPGAAPSKNKQHSVRLKQGVTIEVEVTPEKP